MDIRTGAATLLTALLLPTLAAAQGPDGSPQPDAGQRLDAAPRKDDGARDVRAIYSPITSSERASWLVGEIASPGALSSAAFTSAWMTSANQPYEWSRSAPGYGRRFADAQAATAISRSIEAGLGSLWGEDPRYFRSGKRESWARVRHAMASVALARRPDGRRALAWGRFAGSVTGNVIENTWLPPSAATRSQTAARIATGFAGQLAANLWAEFWPDLRQRLPMPQKFRRGERGD